MKLQARSVAILQSAYIPWKGYFDIMGSVDAFVVYDDVQYSKNHWHNRNIIKTPAGPQWLTIPVSKPASGFQLIDQVKIARPFALRHLRSIEQNYARAPHFPRYKSWLAKLYGMAAQMDELSAVNQLFLQAICSELQIATPVIPVRELGIDGGQTERLVRICRHLSADTYVSGPSAKSYLDLEQFAAAGIAVKWVDYGGYPEYSQLHGDYVSSVSVLDLLLNQGPHARAFMKSPDRLFESSPT